MSGSLGSQELKSLIKPSFRVNLASVHRASWLPSAETKEECCILLLSGLMLCFLIQLRPTCIGVVPPTVGWAFLCQA